MFEFPDIKILTPAITVNGAGYFSLEQLAEHKMEAFRAGESLAKLRAPETNEGDRITKLEAEVAALRAERLNNPATWEYRWLNPANDEKVSKSTTEWQPIPNEPAYGTLGTVRRLSAYTYRGVNCYEVRHNEPKAAASETALPLKSHEVAGLVNRLRDIAVEHHGAQSLRQRISNEIVPLASRYRSDPAIEAIQFAIELGSGGSDFLRVWNEGGWDVIRRDWPEAPEGVYVE